MADRSIKQFPHCDARVLHAPKECLFCDKHPQWQELRALWGINFTGQRVKGRSKCPAEKMRTLKSINRWGGNVAMTKERRKEMDAEMKRTFAEVERMQREHGRSVE